MAQFANGIVNWLSHEAWNGVYALLTIGLLITAVAAALYARKQLQAELRPYVIVWVEESKASPHLFDIAIKNIGRRPAMNVSISLDPPPQRASDDKGHEISKAKMLTQPIAMIAPNQELRLFYDSHIDRKGRTDLPTFHNASYTYEGNRRNKYQESSVLDLEALRGTLFVSVNTVHDIGKSLKEIQKTFRNASVLQKYGVLETETAVESRRARKSREYRERKEAERSANDLLERVGYGENYLEGE